MVGHVEEPTKSFGSFLRQDFPQFQPTEPTACLTGGSDRRNVHGYIIGEHGDSSIPVWSSVRVGALPLLDPGLAAGWAPARIREEAAIVQGFNHL